MRRCCGYLHRVASAIKRRLLPKMIGSQSLSIPTHTGKTVDFVCNICGKQNCNVLLGYVENREYQSCGHCKSSLRMRSVMYALSMELFGEAIALPSLSVNKNILGLGMSDWEGYSKELERKFTYTNTFYHTEPRLDITNVAEDATGKLRFLISSDVFEHIPVFALDKAFTNARRLLQKGGIFVFTVPYLKTGETKEHFPRLHDFRIIETNGKKLLYNRTVEGEEEIFDDLIFHGGDGMTLEMRMFSEPDVLQRLVHAGFSSAKVYTDQVPEFGIIWPMDWAVPIVARV